MHLYLKAATANLSRFGSPFIDLFTRRKCKGDAVQLVRYVEDVTKLSVPSYTFQTKNNSYINTLRSILSFIPFSVLPTLQVLLDSVAHIRRPGQTQVCRGRLVRPTEGTPPGHLLQRRTDPLAYHKRTSTPSGTVLNHHNAPSQCKASGPF